MLIPRIIPCLLVKEGALVKTIRFGECNYIGDPLNTVHIFNEMEVDELIVLDIAATIAGRRPDFNKIGHFASECFMPLAYGGGVRSIEDIQKILKIGVEKVIISAFAFDDPQFIRTASKEFGSQSILVCIDVKRSLFGKYEVYVNGGQKNTGKQVVEYAKFIQEAGAGEIILNSIDRDGTWEGYDIPLIKQVASAVTVPVVACGGAGKIEDFLEVIVKGGASAAAAGSIFVYQNKGFGVLVNYPRRDLIERIFQTAQGAAR